MDHGQASGSPETAASKQVDTVEIAPDTGIDGDKVQDGSPTGPKSEEAEAKPGLGNFWRILGYSTALDRTLMIISVILSAGAGAALPLMNVVFGRLVGDFNAYFIPGSGVTKEQFLAAVSRNALYIFCLFIAKFVLDYVSIYAFRISGIRISAAVRMTYLDALFNQPISAIDKLPPGTATDSLTTIANTIQIAISDKLALLIQGLALIIAAYAVAFTYSWSLTLVSSSVILFIFVLYGVITPTYLKLEGAVNESNAKASSVAGEVLKAVRTVKSLSAEPAVIARHARWIDQARQRGLKRSPVTAAQFSPFFLGTYANMSLTFWFGIKLYIWGDIADVGTLVVVLFSVLIVLGGISLIIQPLQNIFKAAAVSVSCFRIIDAPRLKQGGLQAPEIEAMSDISFEDVRFTYPGRPRTEILKGLSLVIPARKVTALVGPSGSGKSTIVALLERWYELSDVNELLKEKHDETETKTSKKRSKKKHKSDSTTEEKTSEQSGTVNQERDKVTIFQNSGRLLVGEHNIERLDRKWWRTQIGLVQQEPFLFNESLYDNVSRGLIGSIWETEPKERKRALVEEACREAFADDFIRHLPNGYETMVGESGIKLSGGQRQRLAIARSIVKRPSILILDEATSSIDVRGERIVEAALEQVSKNRTTITIAHRLSTIKKADKIIVLKDGAAVEEGTHSDLISRQDGVYANLVHAQHLELGAAEERDEEDEKNAAVLEQRHTDRTVSEQSDASPNTILETKPHGFFTSVGRLLYEQRRHRLIYCFIVLGAMGGGAAYAVQAFIFSHLIAIFQYTGARLVSSGNFWALMFFILALGVGLCYGCIGYAANSLSVHVSTTYRQSYFESILNKPISWFDDQERSSGTLTARLSTDPRQLEEILGPNMALPLVAIFNITGCTIISFVFGWKLTLVTFFSALPVIFAASFLRVRYELAFESFNAKVFSESSKFAAESIGAYRTVTALTMEESIITRYRDLLGEQVRKAVRKGSYSVLVFALSDSLELACVALAFWYGGQLLGSREYNVLQFFIVYIAIVQGGQAAGTFLAIGPNVAQASAAANRILSYRGDSETSSKDSDECVLNANEGFEVEFEEVAFKYPTRNVPVYKHLSLKIDRGEYVAFVGPSGCGKTTIISLLERFYSIDSGQILIDGINIDRRPLGSYRAACALVSQEPTLFEGTVRENLVLGLPHDLTLDEVEEACKAAEIHDFITSLPQSFDTPLSAGTHASLSGGQKQRLCIARALLRKPRLLLLDEATSSLDSQSERLVQKAIEKVAGSSSVTVVVVAHRLATVQNADRIIVLGEGGIILEEGSHPQLVQERGVYWNMCRAQALDR